MKFYKKKLNGFTLAEMLVVFFIIGVVVSATVSISIAQIDIAKKYQYFAAFDNLRQVAVELLADETLTATPDPSGKKDLLPSRAHYQYPIAPFSWIGFCDKTSMLVNTIGNINCSAVKSSGTFASGDANFITTNGARYFNFGLDPVLNADNPVNPLLDYYTVYVDIDGAFGKGELSSDVMGFKIYRSGSVVPLPTDQVGGTSKKYMTASVKYGNPVTWIDKNVPYLEAACHAGTVVAPDCPAVYLPKNQICNLPVVCEVVVNKP